MLSKEDNELMCRVGAGTPMGEFLRQYWIPALISEELPQPDCPPIRLRLLGENLVAFRATSGKVGMFVHACPHRGASLFFGRNEEEGLRCVYHGWKFDTTGACVDMPSEPAESNFKNKVRAWAYPCIERNGIIWTYMGPREEPPPLPRHHLNVLPDCTASKALRDCNFVQALEGDIVTVHTQFLHGGHVRIQEAEPGSPRYYQRRQPDAWLVSEEHEIGTTYGAWRLAEPDRDYWRIGHFQLPFYTSNANGTLTQKYDSHAWVPIDDEHTMVWYIWAPVPEELRGKPGIGGLMSDTRPRPGDGYGGGRNLFRGVAPDQMQPPTSDWLGAWRSIQNLENDYLIDREAQRSMRSYSGIPNGNEPQDRGMQESMGPIYDRTKEHLGTTDRMIIAARRKLISACKAFVATKAPPPGVENPDLYWMFSGGALVPRGANGIDFTREVLFGRARTVELPAISAQA
jgi:phthalate 4,5-dioxygenase oxygenase subunit